MTQERLKEIVRYNPQTGLFNWLNHNKYKQMEVGSKNKAGYIASTIDGERHFMHRLAWLYMTGEMPFQIDHKNRTRDDNRFKNLRDVPQSINCKNSSLQKNNKSGHSGIWVKNNKFYASIYKNNKKEHIGVYSTIEEAILKRKEKEVEYGYDKKHCRKK